METRSPLGVEEWAFVQSALEIGAQYNVQLGSDRSYEFAAPNPHLAADTRVMRTIENKRLKAVSFAEQQSAWDEARMERGNQQLHKLGKDHGTTRLDLEKKLQRLDSARVKQLKESKRLRKVGLHQAASLIYARQNVCQEDGKRSLLVVEQEKEGDTMEQWLMSELKAIGKRSREATEEDMRPIKGQKKLKKSSLETQADEQPLEGEMMKLQTPGWKDKIELNQVKATEENTKDHVRPESGSPGAIHSAETEYEPQKKFELLDTNYDLDAAQLQLETDFMIQELGMNLVWNIEGPPAG